MQYIINRLTCLNDRRSVGTLRLVRKQKALSPVIEERALQSERLLVVQVALGCRVVKFTRRANLALAGIGPRKTGRHVPVQVVDGVRVFGVRLGQLAGEDLLLLLEPCDLQGFDRWAARLVGCGR